MNCKALLTMPAMVLVLGIGSAFAAPVAGVNDIASADASLVHKVHACHRSCELGPGGWHRHVGPFCRRIACAPRAVYPHRCYVDRWGVRRCRW
jgi:hypothetical protein